LAEDSVAVAEALKKAVADAKGKAEALAAAQGVKVGEVLAISESGVERPIIPIYGDMFAEDAAAGDKLTAVPISPANLDITGTVTVTYVLAH
jgi:uncharacterized protein YggE